MRNFQIVDHANQEAVAVAGLYGIKQCYNVISDKLEKYKQNGVIDERQYETIESWYHNLLQNLLQETSLENTVDIDKFTDKVKIQLSYALTFDSKEALKILSINVSD